MKRKSIPTITSESDEEPLSSFISSEAAFEYSDDGSVLSFSSEETSTSDDNEHENIAPNTSGTSEEESVASGEISDTIDTQENEDNADGYERVSITVSDKYKKAAQRKLSKDRKVEEAKRIALEKLLTKKQRRATENDQRPQYKSSRSQLTGSIGPIPEGYIRYYDTITKTLVIYPSLK